MGENNLDDNLANVVKKSIRNSKPEEVLKIFMTVERPETSEEFEVRRLKEEE